jgi:hypothetical protein
MPEYTSDNQRLAVRAVKLIEALRKMGELVRAYPYSGEDYAGFTVIDEDDRSERCLYLDQDSGAVVLHSWETSGHNGSSYGDTFELLDPVTAHGALENLCRRMEHLGMERERKHLEEERLKKVEQRLRDSFLKRVGIE